jgi:hypothetical protein
MLIRNAEPPLTICPRGVLAAMQFPCSAADNREFYYFFGAIPAEFS